jgi:hypothetical protein
VDITKYKNGVDGWSLISMDGTKGFTPNELVSQKGDTCVFYGALNLLIASGYDISQTSADTFVSIRKIEETPWYDHLFGTELGGFKLADEGKRVVSSYAPNYQSGDFNGWSTGDGIWAGPNRAKAEEFLVKTVQSGKPVLVSMEVNDSFGLGSGAHDATVIGVQTGPDGKLQSVLVSTNWAGEPVHAIPAKAFMDDWLEYKGGEYITVDRKPVAPPPNPNGFSSDLLRELNASGWK